MSPAPVTAAAAPLPPAVPPPPTGAVPQPPPGAAPPRPITLRASDDPATRLAQMDGFFRRNPGYVKVSGLGDAVRGATRAIPGVRAATDLFHPTELGYGQLIHDQMEWQILSRRQPDNPWWMRMNSQLVSDPIRAEAHIRAGREPELTGRGEKAWAAYVHASDAIRSMLGIAPDQTHIVSRHGERLPVALSDAYRGASLLDRIKIEAHYKPLARKALWKAHMASLQTGRDAARDLAKAVNAKLPQEQEFGSSWLNFVGYWAAINPPATGTQALLARQLVLPLDQITDRSRLSPLRRLFVNVLAKLDRSYERDHPKPHPAAGERSASSAPAT